MNIVKYRPGTSLLDMADTLFNDLLNDSHWGVRKAPFSYKGNHPAVDVKADENGYTLEADLPGFTEKDIEVKVENELLTISSVNQEAKEEKKDEYLIRERRGYSFKRSFVLPKDVDRAKIEAVFKDGVLTLRLTKAPEAKPKQIEIKVN